MQIGAICIMGWMQQTPARSIVIEETSREHTGI